MISRGTMLPAIVNRKKNAKVERSANKARAVIASAPVEPKPEVLTASKPDVLAQANTTSPPVTAPSNSQRSTKPEVKSAAVTEPTWDAKGARKKAAEKAAEKKETETKAKKAAASKNPERYWVQVATGAYKPDLGKEWSKLQDKYRALLARRNAWTTPLNRTNRLLTGPFRTANEAQAFVNRAAGSGFMISAFTSVTGQPVEPIGR